MSRIFRTLVGGLLRLSDHRVALPEQLHVQISFGRPARAGDVPEPGGGQVDGRVAVGDGSYHAGSSANLSHDALERIVGSDAAPVFFRERVVRQGLGHRRLDQGAADGADSAALPSLML